MLHVIFVICIIPEALCPFMVFKIPKTLILTVKAPMVCKQAPPPKPRPLSAKLQPPTPDAGRKEKDRVWDLGLGV